MRTGWCGCRTDGLCDRIRGVWMLRNNNLKICRKLVRREFQFHKGQTLLLIMAVTLVCMLYTFSFSLGNLTYKGFLYSYRTIYGSDSHIIYENITEAQAAALKKHPAVKDTAALSAVGVLSDEMLENRNVRLAAVSESWARETDSIPVCGRMPEEKDRADHDKAVFDESGLDKTVVHGESGFGKNAPAEIALDEITMNSLLIPHEIGAEVPIKWRSAEGEEYTHTFRLCGWWENQMGETDSCAWITAETAEELCGKRPDTLMLGVTLYLPGDLEKQAKDLLADLGLKDISYTTNLAYNKARQDYAGREAVKFYRMNLIVVLCGVLMICHIVQLSAQQNIRFYGRVKSLGMTPRQIRVLAAQRAVMVWVPGILPGWILGFLLCVGAAPYVVVGMERNPAFAFFQLWPFVLSALLAGATTLTACLWPVGRVMRSVPAQAVRYIESVEQRGRKGRKTRAPVARRMALTGISRQKKQSLPAAFSLLLSLVVLCCVRTMGTSYDEEKYLDGMALCDYRLCDASAASGVQRYNPKSRSITPKIMEALSVHPAVTDMGQACTMEVPLYAKPEDRARIIDAFEEVDEQGRARKEYMADEPDWLAGYEKMRETGEYIGIVTGVDGLMLKNAMARQAFLEGGYDKEAFDTGKYVIAAGAASSHIRATPPVGSKVDICSREFEIMASVPLETTLLSGKDSRQAQYNITYYLPLSAFEELFPEHGIRNVAVNIRREEQKAFEDFLSQILEGTGTDMFSYKDYQWTFRNAVFHLCMIPLFVGSVMLLIGMLNFANALAVGTLVRKREFAVCESLGMTKKQLRRMLLWEGACCYGVILVLLVPGTGILTWLWGRWWLAHTNTWCITWRFSLLPLWVSLPVLLILSLAVPLYFFKKIAKESVTERLRELE